MTLRRLSFALSAATTLVALMACSSSSSGGSGSPEAACDSISENLCGKLNSCVPLSIQLTYGDLTSCTTREKKRCLGALNAPSTGLTPAAASQCASDISAAGCDTIFVKLPSSCEPPGGLLEDGTACGVDDQCKGKKCRKAAGAACGACSTLVPAGGQCETSSDCADQNACAGGKCVIRAKAGAACSPAQPCEGTLRCAGGTCTLPLAAGAACTPGAGDACDGQKGLFCDASSVCKSITVANAGEVCGRANGAFIACAAGGSCKTTGTTGQGTCLAAAADGAACNDTSGPRCLTPARCVSGVCTITDPASCK